MILVDFLYASNLCIIILLNHAFLIRNYSFTVKTINLVFFKYIFRIFGLIGINIANIIKIPYLLCHLQLPNLMWKYILYSIYMYQTLLKEDILP